MNQVTPEQYRSFVLSCNPDVVTALSDIPFTPPPFSQKRITKSLERSITWLSSLLQPLPEPYPDLSCEKPHPLNIFVHMCGDTSEAARQAFSDSLLETLHGKDAEMVKPYKRLDDAVTGYSFDLVPLRSSVVAPTVGEDYENNAKYSEQTPNRRTLDTKPFTRPNTNIALPEFITLLQSSLRPLPTGKPRIVTGASSPHEVLRLINEIGVDLFDVAWAQKAADWGIALDFAFPVRCFNKQDENVSPPKQRENGKRDLGHNLYLSDYAMDFSRLANSFVDGASTSAPTGCEIMCPCITCSPTSPTEQITHSSVDVIHRPSECTIYESPFSRAYLHHLLHTHEMSAHALLAAHNLAVAEAFFTSVRALLGECVLNSLDSQGRSQSTSNADLSRFTREVTRFFEVYDSHLQLFEEAKQDWIAVDYARGKGRLAREKAKLGEVNLSTKVEKVAELDERSTEVS